MKSCPRTLITVTALPSLSLRAGPAQARTQVGDHVSHGPSGRSIEITVATGESLRITRDGDYTVHVQVAKKSKALNAMITGHLKTGFAFERFLANDNAGGASIEVRLTAIYASASAKN